MGTRGYRIIKFKGRFWIFYNNYDSYPDGLGKSLVNGIPVDPEEYQKWLQSQRDFFAKWDSLLQKLLIIQPEDMQQLHENEPYRPIFHAAFDDRLPQDAPPFYASGFGDGYIEWTYTIDLDREVFSVDSGAHFRLKHIPRNDEWIKALFLDTEGNRFLLPQLLPADSIATLSLDPPSFTVSTEYETLQTRLVRPKSLDHIPRSCLTGPRLRWMLFDFFQQSQQRDLCVNLLGWQAQDLPFRELAFFILCLAAGGENLALVDQRHAQKPYGEGLYLGMITDNESEGDPELASSLGVGYHMDGLPEGSAPAETKYWFEGALICLTPQLDYPGVFEKAIANAIEYGRANCTQKSFNAVLISIEHLVLIKSKPDGSVDHTELMPLVSINTNLSKDSRARYGDQALDAFYDARFTKNIEKIDEDFDTTDVERVRQHVGQQDGKSNCVEDSNEDVKSEEHGHEGKIEEGTKDVYVEAKGEDKDTVKESEETEANEEDARTSDEGSDEGSEYEVELIQKAPVTKALIKNSFVALIQFFEATTLETLRLTQANEARLPEEICEMVLRNVSDIRTYNSCLKVSRRFRRICQQRPLVMDNIVFLEPLPNDPALLIPKDEDKGTQDPLPSPDFLAVEVFSDRQMEVWLHSGGGLGDALEYLVVAGYEWNRKTYVANGSVRFRGLCVSTPRADKARKRKRRAAWRHVEESSSYGSEGTPWGRVIDAYEIDGYEIDTESETSTLGQFWKDATRALKHFVRKTEEPAWTLPPNTLCYFGTQESFSQEAMKFHYLYLRVKRTSKYWDDLWDDIIREASENLDHTDDGKIKHGNYPEGEVIGADDPYVILAIGMEVRLFRWEQGFDDSVDEGARRKKSPSSTMRELNPGKILSLCEKTDREEIEKFLDMAEQHKETIKARISEKCGRELKWST